MSKQKWSKRDRDPRIHLVGVGKKDRYHNKEVDKILVEEDRVKAEEKKKQQELDLEEAHEILCDLEDDQALEYEVSDQSDRWASDWYDDSWLLD